MKFTVLGSKGFIGRHLTLSLREQGIEVDTPPRDAADLRGKNLGHVVYAIGLTGNFRQQLRATVEAHVNVLQKLLEGAVFDSWLYLSSTRVYGGLPAGATGRETEKISVMPSFDTLYDLSKLLGEAVCLGHAQPTVRVARLSNVYGADQGANSFLGAVLAAAIEKGEVTLQESPASSKDYICIDDAIQLIQAIATGGRERLYNVASGKNTAHKDLAAKIETCGYKVHFKPDAPTRAFPAIDASRIKQEFRAAPRALLDDLPILIEAMKQNHEDMKK